VSAALSEEPTAAADAPEPPRSVARQGWQAFKTTIIYQALAWQKRWLWALVLLTLLSVTVTSLSIVVLKQTFDDAIIDLQGKLETTQEKLDLLGQLTGTLVALGVLGFFVGLAVRQVGARVVYQLEYDTRSWLYDRLQALDPRSLDRLAAGQLVTRALTDLAFLQGLTAVLPVVAVAVALVLALVVVLIVIDPALGMIAFASVPINLFIVTQLARRLRALSWLALHRRAAVTTAIDQPVRGIRVVKAFGAEDEERRRVSAAARAAYSVAITRIHVVARFGLSVKAIPLLVNALLLFLGARLAVDGGFTVGALLVYLALTGVITAVAASFDDTVSAYQLARAGSGRIFELTAGDPPPAGEAALPAEPTTGLVLRAAAAADSPPVDLELPPGTWGAVTGPPGSGTSAVGRLAAGVEPLADGQVLLDGLAVEDIRPGELRQAARLVQAEPFLFGRSARENLLMGAGGGAITDEQMWAALTAAGAREFVEQLPGALDGAIGDRGLTLSGGQRQRLALARSLVVPPRLLVLDDALSAVNPTLEAEILHRVRAHAPRTTVLLISRRPQPLEVADLVVELPDPVVVHGVEHGLDAAAEDFEHPLDPQLAAAVEAQDVGDQAPPVAESQALDDQHVPTVTNVLAPLRSRVLLAVLLLLGVTLLTILPSVLLVVAVNGILDGDAGPATVVALVLVPVALLISGATYLLRLLTTRITESVLYLLRRRVFQRLSRLGVDYYDRELPGRVASRVVYDLDRVTEFIQTGVYLLLTSLFLMVTSFGLLAIVSPPGFVAVAPYLPVMVLLTVIQIPLADRAYQAARARLGDVVERFQEDFSGRHVIASFGGQAQATAGFRELSWKLRQARRRAATISNVYLVLIELLAALIGAALLARSGRLAIEESASVGYVVFLQVLVLNALAPLPLLASVLQNYLNARASFRALGQPFAAPVLPVERPDAGPCPPLQGRLELREVTFRYPGTERPVLQAVSLVIEPGEVIALVGPTGAGKSSVAKLLARVYDPDAGAVLADGLDLRTLDLGSYRRRLGVVPQDAFCFRGTVASNVAFGRPAATREELEAALRDCGGEAVLASLPAGLDTPVEEEGHNLSPVVRQWVALARAWLVEPDVLVLDEATSTLQAEAEQRVVDALRRLDRTAVVVTHRLPVAARADRVLVVEAGKIVEQGSHADLLKAGGRYAELWAHGAAGAEPAGAPARRAPAAAPARGTRQAGPSSVA
jgi:ATP-binding cassette subfamily B protein